MEFCGEDEVKVESSDSAICIGGKGCIVITNPSNIISITVGQLLAEIFRKPQGYEAFWEHLHRGNPAETLRLLREGDFNREGGCYEHITRFLHGQYFQPQITCREYLERVFDDGRDDEVEWVLPGCREAYVLLAEAWNPSRTWTEMLMAAGAIKQQKKKDPNRGMFVAK